MSLLASSQKYGLVFVGGPNKLVAIKVSDIVKIDNSSSQNERRVDVEDYPRMEILLPSKPSFLTLSCDSLTLLVCVLKSGTPFSLFYDVRAFARQVIQPLLFFFFIFQGVC